MTYELKDKKLKCLSCEKEFVFSKGEQEFYLEKAFSEPRRCNECRKSRKKDKRKKRRQLIKTLQGSETVSVKISESKEEKPVSKALGINVGEALDKVKISKKGKLESSKSPILSKECQKS